MNEETWAACLALEMRQAQLNDRLQAGMPNKEEAAPLMNEVCELEVQIYYMLCGIFGAGQYEEYMAYKRKALEEKQNNASA